ncbi:MAG: hypothetical protein JO108_32170 [Acidobacteriaceae bacterium]|nr:hypothetical protein [Acidobacteriaceae bacterium]
MDVKQYYRKIREIENSLTDTYQLVVSLETADGGKAGLMSEVSRSVAAKLIVEGRATLAGDKDKARYVEAQVAAKRAAEKAAMAKRVQVAIIADPELHGISRQKGGDNPSGGK